MLSFPGSLKVYLGIDPVDMRKSYDGLHCTVTEHLRQDPRSGALFVFTNRRKTRLKILHWDGTGFWVLTKRLEQGTFFWPKLDAPNSTSVMLAPEAFAMLTDGIDMQRSNMRKWYLR